MKDDSTGTQGPADFDFLMGKWRVTNRRLRQRFVRSEDWDVFTAESTCRRFLDGVANVEEIAMPSRGFSGLTLRLFDVEQQHWSIYWINSHTGKLFPPVHGRFDGDRGEFFGDDVDDGKPVKVRFVWIKGTPGSSPRAPRWEQAFSADSGKSWETNWIMEFEAIP
ncbi:MAG TPA: hypothetical protein VGN07_10730 [Steroidobacteraceae bacterium]